MPRHKATDSALSVPVLLNEAQRASASGHLRYAKVMWDLAGEDPEHTLQQLVFGAKLFMTVAEKNIYQERILRFLATFVSETKSQDQLDFVEALLERIVALTYAADPAARWRACQLVHCVMSGLPGDAAISDDAADAVQDAMLLRLDDPKPNVRAAAVRALARLPIPDDDGDFEGCPVTAALLDLLASEKSKDVRKAVLASLPAAPVTQAPLLERTRDESDDVRRVTYLAIAEKVRLRALGGAGGALLVRRGLEDRTAAVSEAAGAMVSAWLDGACGGEPLALLRWLDPAAHPEEAELALRALMDSGRLNAVQIGKLAAEEGLGLRAEFGAGDDAALMAPEEALLWRVVCEYLASEATSKGLAAAATGGAAANIEAAAAGDRLEALEAALPPSVEEMIAIVAAHVAAGPAHRFAAAQLMALAAQCMDFTDATGRRAAAALLNDLLAGGWEEGAPAEAGRAWMEAAGQLARKVHATPEELAAAVLGALGQLKDRAGAAPSEVAWLHALRAGGMMLEALPSARPAAAAPSAFTLGDFMDGVVAPGLGHASADVRCEAVRCLGLYCMLDGGPTPLAAHLPALRAAAAAAAQPLAVRAMAARALGDLALQRGAKALDALLVAQADAAEGAASDTTPTVDLLLEVLAEWQDAFAAATAAPSGRRRRRSTPSAAEAEAAAELGTAVVEALVRLVAVNEFRQAADERRGEASALEDGEVLRLLVALLALHFDPGSEAASRLRQCLSVFFERFASLSVTSQQYLATAVLPAARTAAAEDVAAGRRTNAASPVAPQVLRFCLQLLQLPVVGPDGRQEPLGHEPLAELVLGEILGCARRPGVPKPYLAALCKLPLALPMYDAGEDTRETAARIRVYAARAAQALAADKVMARDLAAAAERYAAGGPPAGELAEEEVAALLSGVKAHVEAFCAGFPQPFDEEEEGEEAEGGAVEKRPAAKGARAARRKLAPAAPADDDAEVVPRGRTLARKAPAREALADSDDDSSEEEEDAPEMPPSDSEEESSDDEVEEESGDEREEEEEEAGENAAAAVASARKARRQSVASVAALREALRENAKITDDDD